MIAKYFSLAILLLTLMPSLNAQTITGNVRDASGPLPGATVLEKGTQNGTQTDFDGNFTIEVSDSNAILVISYIGYATQESSLNGRNDLSIVLAEDAQSLDEVVIIGYGQTQNKRLVTTAVATVKSETIKQLPISQAEAALQGTIPGVVVQQNSGSPGSPQTVRVRGIGTPNNSNPLFIVDGIQVPNLSFLNPNDIVSQTVLKDAASTAIYGSRGGNGVILVETLKGQKRDMKPQVSINTFYGVQSLFNKPNLMNRDQYLQYYNQGVEAVNGNTAPGFRGAFTDAERALLPDTDWYDVVFDDALIQNVYGSVVGGTDILSYSLSGGFFDQEGILGGEGKSEFNRRNIRASLSIDLTDKITLDASAQYQFSERFTIPQNTGGAGVGISSFINALPPIYPAFDEEGNFFNPFINGGTPVANGVPINSLGAVTNPLFSIAISNNEATQDATNLNLSLNYDLTDNLRFRGWYGAFSNFIFNRSFTPLLVQPEQQFNTSPFVNYTEIKSRQQNRQWGGTIEYDFGRFLNQDHNLNVLLGYEAVETTFIGGDIINDTGSFLTNDFDKVNFALSEDITDATVVPGTTFPRNIESFFGKIDYNFKEKYLFSAVLRRDNSSSFGPDNRVGWFPAVSAGWVISEEEFLTDSKAINLLKLRGAWGISGNDQSSSPFAYAATVNTQTSYAGQPGIALTSLSNPVLGWEELTQFNVGLDINALDNKLGITLDYYIKETSDILLGATTPLTSGLNPAIENTGSVENRGFEVLVSYRENYESGFGWNIGANLGLNKNEVTDLGETSFIPGAQLTPQFNDFATRTQVGDPIASFYGFVVEGVDAQGNLIFADLDDSGNNQLSPDDGDKAIIGDPNPDATVGLTLGMNYKGFDLSAFMSGTLGNDIFDATIRYDALGTNRPAAYITEPGAPRNIVVSASPNGEQLISDFHVQDGSYLKMKNVSLGYSLPEEVIDRLGLKRLRLYVSGQNLFVLTNYNGIDPEIGQNNTGSPLNIGIDQGFFPQARQFILGLNIDF
ncbi:SusC/RagA family TonB-linked outer membrane protein [Poritiphilus flavus]|uniref:SusC/RagA family TonB-linked outer membrane protein n=1 Tax=Poritiphilus flavus TaxID=2697053 RepID=A0A6L9EAA2_9FLAO|nr:TonB-dependent receptor [Poritiphilus flavus]NAS11468.1 SusC/RagA family TonB-linked outer membrane protein [Poritiphilus flavus]